jgi:hypothetical protein
MKHFISSTCGRKRRTMRYFLLLTLLICCQSRTGHIPPEALNIFSDFHFVGSGSARFTQDGLLDTIYIPTHGEKELPQPDKLEKGTQYIFHYKEGAPDNEAMGIKILPERLKKLGFKIIEAPDDKGRPLLYPFIGGPYFYIKFSSGQHEAVIFNKSHADQNDQDKIVDDYVLVFLQ